MKRGSGVGVLLVPWQELILVGSWFYSVLLRIKITVCDKTQVFGWNLRLAHRVGTSTAQKSKASWCNSTIEHGWNAWNIYVIIIQKNNNNTITTDATAPSTEYDMEHAGQPGWPQVRSPLFWQSSCSLDSYETVLFRLSASEIGSQCRDEPASFFSARQWFVRLLHEEKSPGMEPSSPSVFWGTLNRWLTVKWWHYVALRDDAITQLTNKRLASGQQAEWANRKHVFPSIIQHLLTLCV